MTKRTSVTLGLLLLSLCSMAFSVDLASRIADRKAIERVYYNHRTGAKPPVDTVLTPVTLERLVRTDLKKEGALKLVYGIDVTPAMLAAEVQRIETTTRAPEVLAEIKSALGNNAARFANAFAKPIIVERLLREHFENDTTLHAAERREIEQTRAALLAALQAGTTYSGQLAILKRRHPNAVTETVWQLSAPPAATPSPTSDEIEIRKRFGPNAQILSSPRSGAADQIFYFDDMPRELQTVLRVQLRQPGDVSAVIETAATFLVFTTKEKTDAILSVAALSLPKRNYEEWVDRQKEIQP